MNEMPKNNFEEGLESIPTPEEISSVFEQLIGDKKYEEVQRLEDEQGVYIWNISILLEGIHTEYQYMRKGKYSDVSLSSKTIIDIVFYDDEGIPTDGWNVAEYIGEDWKLTP